MYINMYTCMISKYNKYWKTEKEKYKNVKRTPDRRGEKMYFQFDEW